MEDNLSEYKIENNRTQGFEAQHYAYRLNNIYFSPAQFAMAYIAVREKSEIEETLNKEVNKVLNNEYSREDIPLFYDAVKNKDAEKKRFTIDDMDGMAFKIYKTHKFIRNQLVLSVNANEQKGTISDKYTVTINVDSRRKRTAKTPFINVTLKNPFIKRKTNEEYDMDSLTSFSFVSSGLHTTKNISKLNPFSEGVKRENGFVDNLAKLIVTHFKGSYYNITEDEIKSDFRKNVFIMDAYASRALSYLDKENKSSTKNISGNISGNIKGLEKIIEEVIMPFDFDRNPRYVFESFLQLHGGLNNKKKNKGHNEHRLQKRFFLADKYLMAKDISSTLFNQAFKKHIITREVFIRNKHWPKDVYYWAINMALIEHFYKEKRRFTGYTLEFEGTSHETVAMAFKNSVKTKNNYTSRIINDTYIPSYPMYKETTDIKGKQARIDKNPLEYVNYAIDRNSKNFDKTRKAWVEIDTKTGRKVLCSIFEIIEPVLTRGAEILRLNKIRPDKKYLNVFDLRGLLYIKPINTYYSSKSDYGSSKRDC